MDSIASALKMPMLYSAEQVFGGCLPEKDILGSDLITRIYTYAVALIFGICLLATAVFWFIGDMIEWAQGKEVGLPEIKLSERVRTLDPEMTKRRGWSLSTFQYTQNPEFCAKSDWGQYYKQHPELKFNECTVRGTDLLTAQGCTQICDALQRSNSNYVRISLEWADIRNDDGTINPFKLHQYREAIQKMRDGGVEHVDVAMSHFVAPMKDGKNIFNNPESVKEFKEFGVAAYRELHHLVDRWFSFNELGADTTLNHVLGFFPAEGKAQFFDRARMLRNQLDAHKELHKALHEIDPDVFVGFTHQVVTFEPSSRWNYVARAVDFVMTYLFHESVMQWLEKNQKHVDGLGIQYYTINYMAGFPEVKGTCKPGERMVEGVDFRFFPQGMLPVLRDVHKRLPDMKLMVTETGTAGTNREESPNEMDERRETYANIVLHAIGTAQEEGIPIDTVALWGLKPNAELWNGYKPEADFGYDLRTRETDGFKAVARHFGAIKEHEEAKSQTSTA